MARLQRFIPPGIPQHVIQRGNNRNPCFVTDQDFAAYARWLKKYAAKFDVDIHAWVFMTNHVHLLLTPNIEQGLSSMMQSLGRSYVRYFNQIHERTGTLWEGRFKSCLVDTEQYLLACYRYIELNPVRANMVSNASDYAWSSYHCNALGVDSDLCTPHEQYLGLGDTRQARQQAYRTLFRVNLNNNLLREIRKSTNQGLVLGSDSFKETIERRFQRKIKPARMGRPRKSLI